MHRWRRQNISNARHNSLIGTEHRIIGTTAVVGVRARESSQGTARVVQKWSKPTLQGFVCENFETDAQFYADEGEACKAMLQCERETANRSDSERVCDMVHTNGVESFKALLKFGCHGRKFRHFSEKRFECYVRALAGQLNTRHLEDVAQLTALAPGMGGKRTTDEDLAGDIGAGQ